MLLDEIGGILASSSVGVASSSGLGGYVLIKSWLPGSTDLQDKVVVVVETPGRMPGARDNLDYPRFQIQVRGSQTMSASSAYPDARTTIQAARDALIGLTPGYYSSSGSAASSSGGAQRYAGLIALQEPFLLNYDVFLRPHLVCNFEAWRSRT